MRGRAPSTREGRRSTVLVSNESLEKLARLCPREHRSEIHGSRAFDRRQLRTAVSDEQCFGFLGGVLRIPEFHNGLHLLAEILVRYTDDSNVLHKGMLQQYVLGLLRIDIDAAGNDHVGEAIRSVEVAVRIQPADIPISGPTLWGICVSSLYRVLVIGKSRPSLKANQSLFARSTLLPIAIKNVDLALHCRPYRTRMGQPIRSGNHRCACALRSAVVFPHDGSPPLDHPPLDVHWAGSRSMHGVTVTR